ncbi:MAG: M20/M25/M40 family metallo-hydrolase, partial [Terriglobales bacterium]
AELTDPARGITVNPGVISGGTRSNVIAAEAQVRVDVRARHAAYLEEVERQIRSLTSTDSRVRLAVRGCINRPPMERTAAIARLFQHAQGLGRVLGLNLAESATGGGSDGNFTAAVGTPTLDGLGMVGEGAHSPGESFLLDQMVPRTVLLAGLFLTL